MERIERAFQEQHSVIIDNTNVTVHDRQPLIDTGRRYNTTITGYYFEPDVTGSRTRNQKREGKAQVPGKVIFITVHKLEPPSYTEGFDTLYYVRVEKNSTSAKPAWEREEIPKSGLEEYNG